MKVDSVRAYALTASDNVATMLDDGRKGASCSLEGQHQGEIRLLDDVAYGHKIAIGLIDSHHSIVKYGETIGRATARIEPGEWVHIHNVESMRGRGDRG